MNETMKLLQDYSVKMLETYREAFEDVNIQHFREFGKVYQKIKVREEGTWELDPLLGYECTSCHGITNIAETKGYYFCPRCGARMTNVKMDD